MRSRVSPGRDVTSRARRLLKPLVVDAESHGARKWCKVVSWDWAKPVKLEAPSLVVG